MFYSSLIVFVFFFNDTATTEIYTLSLHDALPIFALLRVAKARALGEGRGYLLPDDVKAVAEHVLADRKSTRLNSSHANISYAVFCLKKKKKKRSHSQYMTLAVTIISPFSYTVLSI